jgi:hypothetical protein
MVFINRDSLVIRFPELHENAGVKIDFQRTLRLPDDGETHYLPPGLGKFPLRHIEDFDLGSNNHLKKRGGVIMPMFQADALWLNFSSINFTGEADYPIALKIGTGKICAVSGDSWSSNLNRDPQDYVVVPEQPWLDGYNVGKDIVKQFVAAPMGQGFTVEEQLTGNADVGGIQIQAFPMKKEYYDKLNVVREPAAEMAMGDVQCCYSPPSSMEMGLAAGGSMQQEIYEDPYNFEEWDLRETKRCFITLANAEQWMDITGEEPPMRAISAKTYTDAGLPWFDYYDNDKEAISGAKKLGKIKSIKQIDDEQGSDIWHEDGKIENPSIVNLMRRLVKVGNW